MFKWIAIILLLFSMGLSTPVYSMEKKPVTIQGQIMITNSFLIHLWEQQEQKILKQIRRYGSTRELRVQLESIRRAIRALKEKAQAEEKK